MSNTEVQIHHVLHGYNNGHSLIASSIDLNINEKKSLLIMSDMSGPSMEIGFEEYITGYPLNNINSYALAKTWYAPEMKRPGCVWTHTLIINFSDLININQYSDIAHLFKKPTNFIDNEYYNKPLLLDNAYSNNYFKEQNNIFDRYYAEIFLYYIYKFPNKNILFKALDSKNFESLIISIWLQQWPRLRRNFYFCTGAISPRILEDKTFDFQIITSRTNNNLIDLNNYFIIDNNQLLSNISNDNWIVEANNDLERPGKLKQFLNYFGADIESRSSFIPLVNLFSYFNSNKNDKTLTKVINILSDNFNKSLEANNLKTFIFNNTSKNSNNTFYSLFPVFPEEDILFEFSVTNRIKSFDLEKLNIKERFLIFLNDYTNKAFELLNELISLEINDCGVDFLKIASKKIDSEKIKYLNHNYRKLLLTFVLFNPEISYNRIFWDIGYPEQIENYITLYNNRSSLDVDWQIITNLLLEIDSSIVSELFTGNYNFNLNYLLNWLNDNGNKYFRNEWINLLKIKSEEILDWVNSSNYININTLNLLLTILNPNSKEVLKYGSTLWQRNITQYSDNNNNSLFYSFILAIAFNNPDKNSFILLSSAFEFVYYDVMNGKLDYYLKYLEIHTKPLFKWNEWDKCKKLRKALVDKYLEYQWPIKNFGDIFKNREVIEHLLKYYKNSQKYLPFKTELRKKLETL